MTMRIVLPIFLVAGLAVASARSYTVSLTKPNVVGATELQPGDYKIEVNGDKAVLRQGKFPSTVVRYGGDADGKLHIQEIRIGGTRTKLVFSGTDAVVGSR